MVVVNSKTSAGLVGIVLGVVVGIIIGSMIGSYSSGPESDEVLMRIKTDQWISDGGDDLSASTGRSAQELMDMVSTENIGNNLEELTREPHLAGTKRDEQLARFIKRRFEDAGFDTVAMPEMKFLLSRPDSDNPNLIRIYDGSDNVIFTSNYKEKPLHKDDENPNFIHAFNAFTPAGDVTSVPGEAVVYVNYGRIEDFEKLKDLGLNVSGRIALMRYGKIYRGNKVLHASQFGAVGAILYSDPDDVAREGLDERNVYPYTNWLPETGMQRGSTYNGKGDPLTPGWPSIDKAYRIPQEKAILPKIPAQPIGYGDARQILMRLGGPQAPTDWQGKIPGISYKLGPMFLPEYSDFKLRLTSNNYESVVNSYNVIGVVNGAVEPDRYVIIGNHRDAWGFGGSDPSSGTAELLETARIIGKLREEGWKPRRSLIFCSWGSEEYGLIGSTEWVEEHVDRLQDRTVSYINTDTCASGPHVQLRSSPLLFDATLKIAGMVPGVMDASKSIKDEWEENDRRRKKGADSYPVLRTLGSGSDFAHFSFYAGIPAMDIWFRKDQAEHAGSYATYHTGYDTFFNIKNNTDPGFKIIQGCGRLALLFLKYLSDSLVLPLSLQQFPKTMDATLTKFETEGQAKIFRQIYKDYDELLRATRNLQVASERFYLKIDEELLAKDPYEIRKINDQLMKFEQIFVIPTGLPGRPLTRHAIFAPSKFDSYASAAFPGLSDLLYKYDELQGREKEDRDEEIKRHISDLTILIHRAIGLLDAPDKF